MPTCYHRSALDAESERIVQKTLDSVVKGLCYFCFFRFKLLQTDVISGDFIILQTRRLLVKTATLPPNNEVCDNMIMTIKINGDMYTQ